MDLIKRYPLIGYQRIPEFLFENKNIMNVFTGHIGDLAIDGIAGISDDQVL